MQLITIDKDKCKKDGICIAECPFNILKENAGGVPEMIPGGDATCMRCGHCLAVCPSGALTLEGAAPAACEPVKKEWSMDAGAMEQLLKTRRSVRVYRDKPVSHEIAGRLMDMLRWAPTAKNLQPVHWTLVDDRTKIRTMAGMTIDWLRDSNMFPEMVSAWENDGEDMVLRGAPLLAIAHAHKDALNPQADCTIAMTTLELAASAMGIGGCWAGFFMGAAQQYGPLEAYLDLPEGHHVYAALMLGYPKFSYQRIPAREGEKVRWL
ncbi:nitroreductase [Desulfoluna limicola]|uniref:Nitroreductase n=1 Tax=Desulfoluna limicola TaxID=2810562 RepID=A0ABM7PHP7_9BACT|nr:nitroreductase family protein [Desulfoluna limicola]BCS96622.1 nitroreductase [Desulfoluna limicola]